MKAKETKRTFELKKTTEELKLHIALIIADYENNGYEKDFKLSVSNEEATKLRDSMKEEAIKVYENRLKQRFQPRSFYHTAIINIKDNTKFKTLKKIEEAFSKECNFQCYQIIMFKRDKLAYLHFVTLNKETGKNERNNYTIYKIRYLTNEINKILIKHEKEEREKQIAKEAVEKYKLKRLKAKKTKTRQRNDKKMTTTGIDFAKYEGLDKRQLLFHLDREKQRLKKFNEDFKQKISSKIQLIEFLRKKCLKMLS